jgi:hypothetical protein
MKCPYCGAETPEKKCVKCHAEIPEPAENKKPVNRKDKREGRD